MRKLKCPEHEIGDSAERRAPPVSSMFARALLLSTLVLGCRYDSMPMSFQLAPSVVRASNGAVSQVDWKRTHMVIINGDDEKRHMDNAAMAAKAGLKNGAAGVTVAGLHADLPPGVKEFDGSLIGVGEALLAVGKSSGIGDTVFIYVTGHGDEGLFAIEDEGTIAHDDFLKGFEKWLGGRNIVFVSDACYSADFVEMISQSRAFRSVSAMSPGLKNETTSCTYFSEPFWHAIANQLDLDGNGKATMEEAFYYALGKYRLIRPETLGSYRASIQRVKSLGEVKDGVVMVTSETCPACIKMEPVFNTANLLLRGSGNFFMIDIEDEKASNSTPTLIVMRDGKEAARKVGAMELKQLSEWLDGNGISIKDFKVSAAELYRQGKYESIIFVKDWDDMMDEMDVADSVKMLTPLLANPNPSIRAKALERLAESTDYIMDLGAYEGVIDAVVGSLGEKDAQGLDHAIRLLGEFSKARPEKIMGILYSKMRGESDDNARVDAASALIYCAKNLGDEQVEKAFRAVLSDRTIEHKVIRNDMLKYYIDATGPAVKALMRILGSEDKWLRWAATDVLGPFLITEAVIENDALYGKITDALRARLRDRDSDVQAVAAVSLGYAVFRFDAVAPLLRKLENDPDPTVANSASAGLDLLDALKSNADILEQLHKMGVEIVTLE